MFFQEVETAALRAGFRHRPVGRGKVALEIVEAAVKHIAPAPDFLLHQFAVFALRALYADKILFNILAFRIAAARDELAVASVAQHHVAPALRAYLVQWNVGHALALVKPPGGPAIGIACARHELPKAAALEHHDPPAVFTILFLRGFR